MTDPTPDRGTAEQGAEFAQRLVADLQSDDLMVLILRGHLYVEAELDNLITLNLIDPDALDVERLSFPTKIDLAVAMGLLKSDEAEPVKYLNWLRNRFAHNLRFEVTAREQEDLRKKLPAAFRQEFGLGRADLAFPDGLRRAISTLVLHVVELQARSDRPGTTGSNDT